jgi:hypothetical protein
MSRKVLVVTGDGGEGYEAWESHPEFYREIMHCLRES